MMAETKDTISPCFLLLIPKMMMHRKAGMQRNAWAGEGKKKEYP
jgi:hypothetical protein